MDLPAAGMDAKRRLDASWLAGLYMSRPRLTALLAALFALLGIYGIHFAIHFTPAFQSLYILPIWIATRLGGRWVGFTVVALTTAVDGALELMSGPGLAPGSFWWDTAIRFGSLTAIMLVFAKLEVSLARYQAHSRHDPLTGLLNRRALEEFGRPALMRAQKKVQPFALVVIDCDRFKSLNDEHGHAAGDEALQMLAQVLESNTRAGDLVARIGGDEFVVVLQELREPELKSILTRIRRAYASSVDRRGWNTSLSIGYAFLAERHTSLEDLMRRADDRMYLAKQRKKRAPVFLT